MTFMSKKLVDIEREQWKTSLKSSTERAIRENKALGLPITYLEDGKIIKEHADGSKEIMRIKEKSPLTFTIKKGTILRFKKKTN